MKLKPAILEILARDDLKRILDDLEIDGVDRRSADAMRAALRKARRAKPDDLLGYMLKGQIQQVCEVVGVAAKGKRDELVGRLVNGVAEPKRGRKKKGTAMAKKDADTGKNKQMEMSFNGESEPQAVRPQKVEKLTLARLERKLFEACDILRGNMDASEYKEYIFGMLFLKRMSDQFEKDRATFRAEYEKKGLKLALIEKQLASPEKYDFFVPPHARWNATDEEGRKVGIAHLKQSVGSGLNKALAAIEDANSDTLQDVLKTINFNRKVGQRTMDDSTLIDFIQHFNDLPLSNDDFEFPDLLGSAYEYLIKYFADSAGKKGGEFYTPSEVVRTMVQIIQPQEGMACYDPCVGSGGMLIQSKQYVQETGGDSRNLFLAAQESNGGTWAICKMNMILHGIRSADIRQGDTIKEPQHLADNGEILRFDRVIANPPFSQNYSRNGMKFPERFHTFMPESGKKADLMFVQHMAASLKSDGRMAVVMPHGVLFRGGEEKECRKKFIKEGILEAVVGLPPGLFYGTGIPASLLVINRDGAQNRKSVLFINADREYKEGKNQNSLRAEDIEKITHVYRKHLDVPKYSRNVPVEELEQEDFNLNIRRYVDNSPPPEPHDVRAHLNGGVPTAEVDALKSYFGNYKGVRELLFQSRDDKYCDFASSIESKDAIKGLIESAPGVQKKQTAFNKALDKWWSGSIAGIEALPKSNSVFALRRKFISGIADALVPQGVLGMHQVRGAFAGYMNELAADFQSVAASGWGPELIPEEDILQSQFPEVLEQIERDQARIAELEGMFAAASASDEDEEGEAEPSEDGVLPKAKVKTLKAEKKDLGGEIRQIKKQVKTMRKDAQRIEGIGGNRKEMNSLLTDASDSEGEGLEKQERVEQIDAELARHTLLETELKTLKANIRQVEKKKDDLVTAARAKISEEEAKRLILERFGRLLTEQFDGYLRQYQRAFIAAIENLWDKYAVTTKQILAERDREAEQLNSFLKELGYE